MRSVGRTKAVRYRRTDLARAVSDLIVQAGDPAKVLELYYWSLEPGALECIRAIVAMPVEARVALQAFLTAPATQNISASLDPSGNLRLRSRRFDQDTGIQSRLQN
jgi:hypothetical protein